MKEKEPEKQPANAKEAGLKMLRMRAERLVKELQPIGATLPHMPHALLATSIVGLIDAASLYCPEEMGKALMESRANALCRYHGFCMSCGIVLGEEPRKSPFCAKCEVEIGEGGQTHN